MRARLGIFHRSTMATVLLALATFTACAKSDTASDTTSADTSALGTGTGPTAAAAAPALNDAQIAHVAVTANAIDSAGGVVAQQKGQHADVKSFGSRMVSDHAGVNKRAVALATKLNVTPEDNDTSRGLQQAANQSRDSLAALSGAAFDAAYIAREVAYHQSVLDALDQVLIPGAQNAELKALLQEVRPAIAAHLALAQQIQGKLPRT